MAHPLTHGIEMYFRESTASRRRVALILLAVSGAFAVLLAGFGRRLSDPDLGDPMRFGFEGPRQWVDRIRLEELAARESPGLYAITYLTAESRKGGHKTVNRSSHPQAEVRVKTAPGEGDADFDLLARVRMLAIEGPVVRSEDLIIERLVRPEYPSEARERNIEGIVEVIALVDTSGAVLQVQVVGGSREPLLESAAAKAILECRYRPYRVHDEARRVWAAYRIAFSLY